MKLYFVARNSTSDFIGEMSLDDIVAKLRSNEFRGDYLVTESTGPSYLDMVKRTDVRWEYVSELVDRTYPPAPVNSKKHASSDALLNAVFILVAIIIVLLAGCRMLFSGMRIE
jgi:hypothetical protein